MIEVKHGRVREPRAEIPPLRDAAIADEKDDAASRQMIEMLETIDDDLSGGETDLDLVKVSDPEFAEREYGIRRGSPAIVYFENGVPSVFDGEQLRSISMMILATLMMKLRRGL